MWSDLSEHEERTLNRGLAETKASTAPRRKRLRHRKCGHWGSTAYNSQVHDRLNRAHKKTQ
jgi:hypothetical protein